MNKKILILGIIIFCGLLAINSANAQDIEVKNKGITFDEFFDYPDGKSSMEFRVKYSDKYDNDAYIIFDADNIVHPDFLFHMNHSLNCGYKLAQGFRDSKNYEIINVEDKNIIINLNEFLDYQNIKITEEGR